MDRIPAIVRDYTEADADATVRSTPYDSVSHSPGWGDSGYRVQVVDHDCPHECCSFDRMVRRWNVNPELLDEVRYWCLNPNCRYFIGDELSYACRGSPPSNHEPVIFEKREVTQ